MHFTTSVPPSCPCVNNCPVIGCDCTDSKGNLLTPAPRPTQPPPPPGCLPCVVPCAILPPDFKCKPSTTPCTATQLASYIVKCPACVSQAGCPQVGCPCKDCSGNAYIPSNKPPQPPRPAGCPVCPPAICNEPILSCPIVRQCTLNQIQTYTKCPACIPLAGCKHPGCDCVDCLGNVLTSPTNPPQPPRPVGCPACKSFCLEIGIRCLRLTNCTDTQLETYVPK